MSGKELQLRETNDEPPYAPIRFHSGGLQDNWEPVLACLDTGTRDEWVNSELLERFTDLDEIELPRETYKTFNGGTYTTQKGARCTWYLEKIRKTYKGVFRVVEKAPFDVVIGYKSLREKSIFDIRGATLINVHHPIRHEEEARMRETGMQQRAEVDQYAASQTEARASRHQQQRAQLDKQRQTLSDATPLPTRPHTSFEPRASNISMPYESQPNDIDTIPSAPYDDENPYGESFQTRSTRPPREFQDSHVQSPLSKAHYSQRDALNPSVAHPSQSVFLPQQAFYPPPIVYPQPTAYLPQAPFPQQPMNFGNYGSNPEAHPPFSEVPRKKRSPDAIYEDPEPLQANTSRSAYSYGGSDFDAHEHRIWKCEVRRCGYPNDSLRNPDYCGACGRSRG